MISDMRECITIQKSSVSMDENGNHILKWENFYNCAAYVNNLSGKEYWAAAQVNAQTDVYFIIRFCSEVSTLDSEHYRIVFKNKVYNISFVDNVKYANKTLKLRASVMKEE